MPFTKSQKTTTLSLHKIYKNTGFSEPAFFHIRTESMILFLYRKIQVGRNLYSGIFTQCVDVSLAANI